MALDLSDDGGKNSSGNPFGQSNNGSLDSLAAMKAMWSRVRNLSSIFFVFGFLIAVIGQAAGVIEAYTAKKLIPRLALVAILAQLSYWFCVETTSIVEDIGSGLQPFLEGNLIRDNTIGQATANAMEPDAGDVAVGVGIGTLLVAGGAAAFGSVVAAGMVILPFILMIIGSLLIGILALMARRVIIMALIIVSPIAILLWAIPSTSKYSKKWLEAFMKMLLIHPLIILLITMGKVMSFVLLESAQQVSGAGGGATSGQSISTGPGSVTRLMFGVAGVIVYVLPFLLIPSTFKMAGSTLASVHGFLQKGQSLLKPSKERSEKIRNSRKKSKEDFNRSKLSDPKASRLTKSIARMKLGDSYNTAPGRFRSKNSRAGKFRSVYEGRIENEQFKQAVEAAKEDVDTKEKQRRLDFSSETAKSGRGKVGELEKYYQKRIYDMYVEEATSRGETVMSQSNFSAAHGQDLDKNGNDKNAGTRKTFLRDYGIIDNGFHIGHEDHYSIGALSRQALDPNSSSADKIAAIEVLNTVHSNDEWASGNVANAISMREAKNRRNTIGVEIVDSKAAESFIEASNYVTANVIQPNPTAVKGTTAVTSSPNTYSAASTGGQKLVNSNVMREAVQEENRNIQSLENARNLLSSIITAEMDDGMKSVDPSIIIDAMAKVDVINKSINANRASWETSIKSELTKLNPGASPADIASAVAKEIDSLREASANIEKAYTDNGRVKKEGDVKDASTEANKIEDTLRGHHLIRRGGP